MQGAEWGSELSLGAGSRVEVGQSLEGCLQHQELEEAAGAP